MAANAAQQFMINTILRQDTNIIRGLHDSNSRHSMIAVFYSLLMQEDFASVCRNIKEADANNNRLLHALKAIPQLIASAAQNVPIDVTKSISSILSACNGKAEINVLTSIIGTRPFRDQYSYSHSSFAFIINKTFKDYLLMSILIINKHKERKLNY